MARKSGQKRTISIAEGGQGRGRAGNGQPRPVSAGDESVFLATRATGYAAFFSVFSSKRSSAFSSVSSLAGGVAPNSTSG